MNRRHFMQMTGGVFATLVMPLGMLQAQPYASPVSAENVALFLRVSEFLTDKDDLKLIVAQRALSNLMLGGDALIDKLRELDAAIVQSGLPNAVAFSKSILMQNTQIADLAKKITKAWYLGYTGTPLPFTVSDDVQFVTYTDALMYRPTLDATIIPSFSREKPNYWFNPPAHLMNQRS